MTSKRNHAAVAMACIWSALALSDAARAEGFTPLSPLPAPAIAASAEDYPGGGFKVANLIDGDSKTQYSSASKGTDTFVEFDFGKPVSIGGLRHVDRNDPATISSSELIFQDDQGRTVSRTEIKHVNKPGGVTNHLLPTPVTARRARWQVTGLGPSNYGTVGGSEMTFFQAGEPDKAPSAIKMSAVFSPVLRRGTNGPIQPVRCTIDYPYAQPVDAVIEVQGAEPKPVRLTFGIHQLEVSLTASTPVAARLTIDGKPVLTQQVQHAETRRSVVYILPHSHVDIGYTELQPDVERKQMANIARGIELARATADYPEGARYKWNVEVLWAVDSYFRKQPPEKQQEFIDAVHKGWIGLDAMYGNELTGLCRPEELMRVFTYAGQLSKRCNVPIESAMISDVPGYTWGIVSAMAQAGVKYWSIGPNYFDRMGGTIVTWENKPFWWVGPTGNDKVLCWVPHQGYAMSHLLRSNLTEQFMLDYLGHLDRIKYPYEISYLRWSGHGDNAVPDETIPDFVKKWNATFESPKIVIATTAEAFRAFEQRHGRQLPEFKGDWTPYWEDGAGSSARETGLNRASAERLVQAETLWAMLAPARFPAGEFHDAWRNVLLYSEHTWGAHNSITEPEKDFVKEQWKIKQAFAVDGDMQSRTLLKEILRADPTSISGVDVYNTTCWPRTELVVVSGTRVPEGATVSSSKGEIVPTQRLANGDLAFIARNVPPFAGVHYSFAEIGQGRQLAQADPDKNPRSEIDNGLLRVRVDEKTGAIVDLRLKGIDRNLADTSRTALNEYLYVEGDDFASPKRSGPVKISVKEAGPVVNSLLIESDAAGCNKLIREVRLVAGADYVEIINTVDKKIIEVKGKAGDWGHAGRDAKEAVHFGFGFNVPDGVMRMDIPYAVMRPELDQIPGACKNWFTVQRWVDVSNERDGVTWATIDAPLVQVGSITANLLGSQTNPDAWIKHLDPSQTLYSWAMNNYWHTNYRAYQEGPTVFRYAIRPHAGAFSPVDAARFGTSLSQPLIVAVSGASLATEPRVSVDSQDVLVTALKPADEGRALIVRLFAAAGRDASTKLRWSEPKPVSVWLSDVAEKPLQKLEGPISIPAWGVVTIRAEFE